MVEKPNSDRAHQIVGGSPIGSSRTVIGKTAFWLRWLALLPASLVAAAVGVFFILLAINIGGTHGYAGTIVSPVVWGMGWAMGTAGGIMAMLFFIVTAVGVAPAYKHNVAWVAFALWSLVSLIELTMPMAWLGCLCALPLGFKAARRLELKHDVGAHPETHSAETPVATMEEPGQDIFHQSQAQPADEFTAHEANMSHPPRNSEMVTIARYGQPVEAQIACARLQAEGIVARTADEQTVQANWLWSNAMGGVRLQVAAEHVERAQQVIADIEASHYELSEEDPLPDEPQPGAAEPEHQVPAAGLESLPFLYTPGAARFTLLSLGTLGLFPVYWLYRNFRVVDARSSGARAAVVVMMFFMFLPLAVPVLTYLLGKQVETLAVHHGIENVDLPSATLAAIYFMLLLSLLYPHPYNWLYLLAGLAMLPINSLAAAVNQKLACAVDPDTTAGA